MEDHVMRDRAVKEDTGLCPVYSYYPVPLPVSERLDASRVGCPHWKLVRHHLQQVYTG